MTWYLSELQVLKKITDIGKQKICGTLDSKIYNVMLNILE